VGQQYQRQQQQQNTTNWFNWTRLQTRMNQNHTLKYTIHTHKNLFDNETFAKKKSSLFEFRPFFSEGRVTLPSAKTGQNKNKRQRKAAGKRSLFTIHHEPT
jgi:hypothetical protein